MMLLSVVMPVYNVGRYLPRCLESLAAQRLQPDEIIAIDDGATDDCPAILADFARRMPNLKVFRQANAGLSAARNAGLERARGKYVAFIDSDDFADPGLYEHLVAMAESDRLDLALCNGLYHFEGREPERPIYASLAPSAVMAGADWLVERLLRDRVLHMVWLHLYRREFLVEHDFRFFPGLVHEDVVWTTRALILARRVRYDARPLIHYRIPIRHFSAEQNRSRLDRLITSSVFNARELARLADDEAAGTPLVPLLEAQLVDGAMSVFHKLEKLADPVDRRRQRRRLWDEGFCGFLWRRAAGWRQRRRILRQALLVFAARVAP